MNIGNLKLKISVRKQGEVEIEMEGDSEVVREEFKDIKENGYGKALREIYDLLRRDEVIEGGLESESGEDFLSSAQTIVEEPYDTLENVVFKGQASSETEWILIYCFYSSSFGKNKFDREDILSKYEETGRVNSSRKRNLTNNLRTLVNQNLLEAVDDTNFALTAKGIKSAKRILGKRRPPVKKNKIRS